MEFEYFKIKEFACKCGCKTNNIDLDYIKGFLNKKSY